MEVAKAALATAELNYNSTKELFAKKVVSAFNLKTSENSYLTAKAQLAQAEAQEVTPATTCLIRKSKSPSDGVVGMLPYRAGALVSASIPPTVDNCFRQFEHVCLLLHDRKSITGYEPPVQSMDEALKNMPEVSLKLNDQSYYEQKGRSNRLAE